MAVRRMAGKLNRLVAVTVLEQIGDGEANMVVEQLLEMLRFASGGMRART
jgi:hypothetical protein